jgi:hypothetical protein
MIASPHFIDDARAGLLKVSDRLFDGLLTRGLIASPVGPFPLQFLVTHRADVVIVTLSNNTAQRWQGEIHLNDPMSISTVQDWVADTPLTFSRRPTGTFASLAIDPFDIRIVAFLKSTDSAAERGGALDLLSLSEPYPNPASATTMISLKTLQDCSASVQVYDILGRLVGTLYEGDLAQGSHAFVIPASRLASGSYQIIARTPSDVICRRLLIVH